MDQELGKKIVLELEANLLALRFKRQLHAYRDNMETILGSHVAASVIALGAIGALLIGRSVAGMSVLAIYLAISCVILPVWSRRNALAWQQMAVPLYLLLTHEDVLILDERRLRSVGQWLSARGLCVGLPSTDGTQPEFVQTELGARVRQRLELDDLLPRDLFGRPRVSNLLCA
ncbi:MAG: hypothetical protein ABSB70_04020 [Candidatus Velthaea sp.]|jgi:hypothetical protein